MNEENSKQEIIEALKQSLKQDRAKTQIKSKEITDDKKENLNDLFKNLHLNG